MGLVWGLRRGVEGGGWAWAWGGIGSYARVVEAEHVAVAVFEGRDQALEVGHVVGELRGERCCVSWFGTFDLWRDALEASEEGIGRCTLSNTVFISSSVKGRILTDCGGLTS